MLIPASAGWITQPSLAETPPSPSTLAICISASGVRTQAGDLFWCQIWYDSWWSLSLHLLLTTRCGVYLAVTIWMWRSSVHCPLLLQRFSRSTLLTPQLLQSFPIRNKWKWHFTQDRQLTKPMQAFNHLYIYHVSAFIPFILSQQNIYYRPLLTWLDRTWLHSRLWSNEVSTQ